MKQTKKAYRELLNKEDADSLASGKRAWSNKNPKTGQVYGQRKRLYGDYLYNQDRVLFDMYYEMWITQTGFYKPKN